uniref:Putative protease inhibitor n=1 Tax=Superstitionia donensis TaxID=311983 RepID=A0A1V1WBJ3_9SCOR
MKFLLVAVFIVIIAIALVRSQEPQCGNNAFYMECGGCDGTCDEPLVACTMICHEPGCYCEWPNVRGPNGECIPREQCP